MRTKKSIAYVLAVVMVSAGALTGIASSAAAAPNTSGYEVGDQVPVQPQADPETGWVVGPETPGAAAGAMKFTAAQAGAARATTWTRTCERGYGTESWNKIKTEVCAGTVTWYKNGVKQKAVNILAFQAAMGTGRPGVDLDAWCSANSFQCSGLYFLAGVAFTILWGVIS